MSNKTAAIIIACMIGFTSIGMGVWLLSRSTPSSSSVVTEAMPDEPVEPPPVPLKKSVPRVPAYRVLTDRIAWDGPQRSQVELTVFLEQRVTEESIRCLMDHLYAIAKKAGPFEFRQQASHIDIRIYARKGQSHIASVFKTPYSEFDVAIRKGLLETVDNPPIVRFGLTEKERQMIWRDIVRVERRANREAEEMYPYPMPKNDPYYTESGEKNQLGKQLDYARDRMKQNRMELAESLGLTAGQIEEIANEGVKNWWETPRIQ